MSDVSVEKLRGAAGRVGTVFGIVAFVLFFTPDDLSSILTEYKMYYGSREKEMI